MFLPRESITFHKEMLTIKCGPLIVPLEGETIQLAYTLSFAYLGHPMLVPAALVSGTDSLQASSGLTCLNENIHLFCAEEPKLHVQTVRPGKLL